MARLTVDEVKHVAQLSRLSLTPAHVAKLQTELSSVITYMDELNEVDTEGIEPTSQTTGLSNVTRQDKVDATRVLSSEAALSAAKRTHNGYPVVAALLNKDNE